jgi:8-oxo-dGTP pyrophosphatase MutT (NUDIX family)
MRYVIAGFIFHQGKLLITFHKKHQVWLHVGGHHEGDETFEETLRREIKEEVNLEVEILHPYQLATEPTGMVRSYQPLFIHGGMENGKTKTWIDYVCIAQDISSLQIQESELGGYRWITAEDIAELQTFPAIKELMKKAFAVYQA